ncbi:MAG: M48 family metalloprotease, partial [Candidatus Omnitrophica bacterium]|nr:M48 family metalloprotease [Candidatus Omnitrophota bacterium]
IPQHEKIKQVYGILMKGSELAKDSIGSYGTAANMGLRNIGKAAPYISRRFENDAEVVADEQAVKFLMEAGYDPREYQKFVERLSRVEVQDLSRFVMLLNTHPPFPERRNLLNNGVTGIDFEGGKIEFKKDTLNEVRQMAVNAPAPASVLFSPELGVHNTAPPLAVYQVQQSSDNEEKSFFVRKRWGWF